ncbi:MAG TPA: aspartate aminotransferase family protein [Anaerolineae bacterium]|nr:aspartate aminotransferase family protein [Anaerolineae bacterium]
MTKVEASWVREMYETVTPEQLEAGRRALLSGSVGGELPLMIARARGASFWDASGREYIDCTSQAWTLNVGACHPKVMAAVREQLEYFTHVRTSFETVPKLMLSKRLAELAPGDLNRVAYCLHGSTAVEGAMKLAMRNRPRGKFFISLWDGFYGRTLAGMGLCYPHPDPFLTYTGNTVRVPQGYCYRCAYELEYPDCDLFCVDMIGKFIENAVDGEPLALIMEPIQGSGGMIDFPKPYYQAVRRLCDKYEMLLIWDEMQTGFGRVGRMFAAELYETVPDILIFGKAIGGGFPLAGSISREGLEGFRPADHSFTFAHFPVSMVAALATLQVLEEERLLERAEVLNEFFTSRLLEMKDKYELIGDVRGPGLMIGIELVRSKKTKEPAREESYQFEKEGLRRGVLFGTAKYAGMGNVVKIKPPLVITDAQAERVTEVFEEIVQLLSP